MQRQERTGHFHVHSKEVWNMFYDGVNNRVQSNRQFTQDWWQWHNTSIELEKNIWQGSIVTYTRQNICKPKTMPKKKFAFQICLTHVLFPNITSIKRQMHRREERTSHFHVHSKEEWNMFYDGVNNRVQGNRQFTQDWRQWHKTSIEAEKTSHKEALFLTTRQNICKPKTMLKEKFALQKCLTHVLFPKITSIKRQMQRQERTGHFHVNSKEEWNKLYDGVNQRVQSNRQNTQGIRQWHKSWTEAGKKYLTRKYWTLKMTK